MLQRDGKIKITVKFRASRRLRFEDTKRIMLPEMRPKTLGIFEKQAPGSLRSEDGDGSDRVTNLHI